MKKLNVLNIAGLIIIFALHTTKASANHSDIELISHTLKSYFDGTSIGQPHLLDNAFSPDATLKSVENGVIKTIPFKTYKSWFPAGEKYDRQGTINAISVTGNVATAEAEILMGGRRYIDYFLLLKTKDGWRISDKIYTLVNN